MPKYLIGRNDSTFSEGDFVIVDAPNQSDAGEKYIRQIGITDEYFLEYLADRSLNGGFASHFWLRTEEENEIMALEGRVIIDEKEFRGRIHEFFKEWPDYADLYFRFYDDDSETPVPEWPEEMLVMIWKESQSWDSFSLYSLDQILVIV